MNDQVEKKVIAEREPELEDREIKLAFGKYATRNSGFLSYLDDVRTRIDRYIRRPAVSRPLNILLAAPPGSGKSFLIKQIVNSVTSKRIVFEEVYVASFEDPKDLQSVFQRVQSINLEGNIPAIFLDEVDSTIGNFPIYKKLLSPMWDGAFFIGKDRFLLGRCILFFAGSSLSVNDASQRIVDGSARQNYDEYFRSWEAEFRKFITKPDSSEKLHDFADRMDMIIRIPPIHESLLGDEKRDEILDLACLLIKKHHPDVQFIGKIALSTIADMLEESNSVRSAEKIIFSSEPNDSETFDAFSFPEVFRKSLKLPSEDRQRNYESSGYSIRIAAQEGESSRRT